MKNICYNTCLHPQKQKKRSKVGQKALKFKPTHLEAHPPPLAVRPPNCFCGYPHRFLWYKAIHICVPNSRWINLSYLSCVRAQIYQLFGTKIWMACYLTIFRREQYGELERMLEIFSCHKLLGRHATSPQVQQIIHVSPEKEMMFLFYHKKGFILFHIQTIIIS